MLSDADLLARFVSDCTETAFADLVHRHLDRVYSVALRNVGGDTHLAQDVAQQVFAALARKAATLQHHRVLGGWLYRTTQFTAIDLVRTEQRRRAREQTACSMNVATHAEPDWERLRPVLDRAIADLPDVDRDAIWLRFFEGRSFTDIGRTLGLAENAARMRVHRATEKLRALLTKRGITSTATALSLALAHQPLVSAPAGLAQAISGAALSCLSLSTTSTSTFFMGLTKLQLSLAAGVVAGSIAVAAVAFRSPSIAAPSTAEATRAPAIASSSTPAPHAVQPAEVPSAAPVETTQVSSSLNALTLTAARTAPATDRLPIFRVQPSLPYPEALGRSGPSGVVLVEFVVDSAGKVRDPQVAQSTQAEFDPLAVSAVAGWEFDSGIKGGRSVNTRMQVTILFDPTQANAVIGEPEPLSLPQPSRS